MLKIDRLFSDHMVLQREKEIRIWGTCSKDHPEIPVTVTLGERIVKAAVESSGKWIAVFMPMHTARKLALTVECGEENLRSRMYASEKCGWRQGSPIWNFI